MKRLGLSILVFFALIVVTIAIVRLCDLRRERALRENVLKVEVGMRAQDVVQILGEPTDRIMVDTPGRYWTYKTNTLGRLIDWIDDHEGSMGSLILEMGPDERVVRVFPLP